MAIFRRIPAKNIAPRCRSFLTKCRRNRPATLAEFFQLARMRKNYPRKQFPSSWLASPGDHFRKDLFAMFLRHAQRALQVLVRLNAGLGHLWRSAPADNSEGQPLGETRYCDKMWCFRAQHVPPQRLRRSPTFCQPKGVLPKWRDEKKPDVLGSEPVGAQRVRTRWQSESGRFRQPTAALNSGGRLRWPSCLAVNSNGYICFADGRPSRTSTAAELTAGLERQSSAEFGFAHAHELRRGRL